MTPNEIGRVARWKCESENINYSLSDHAMNRKQQHCETIMFRHLQMLTLPSATAHKGDMAHISHETRGQGADMSHITLANER